MGETSLFKKVEGVKGNILYTRSEYLNFKYYIKLEIENNPQENFINWSNGAKIKGTIWKELNEF